MIGVDQKEMENMKKNSMASNLSDKKQSLEALGANENKDEEVKNYSSNNDGVEELGERYRYMEAEGKLLKIMGLKKKFGNFTAVNDVNIKMFENEIFALLGHNGAGKTTTISMITGLIMPTKGDGEYHGVDLFPQMKKVRTTLGVCPQLDVLFEDMTVKEHLEM